MKKALFLMMILGTFGAQAQSGQEDAIILNQELEFLEDSINSVQSAPATSARTLGETPVTESETSSLERTYFGEGSDEIRTKRAAPKRRRSF